LTGLGLLALAPLRLRPPVLRPPGAREDFLARCIRCGKCLEACPYDTLRPLGITAGANAHTPYIEPLTTPCYLCHERGPDGVDRPLSKFLRCTEACPTGALRKIENDKEVLATLPEELRIGVSVLQEELCLAWQFDVCGECYYNCPLKDKAMMDSPPYLAKEGGLRPWVNPKHCVGCGMCNYVCPVREEVAQARMQAPLSLYEARYASMVRNLLGRAGPGAKLPAVRVLPRT